MRVSRRLFWSRLLALPFGLALLLAAWLVNPLVGHSDDAERTVLGNLISRALSTPTTQVSIGSVEGALSSDATIRNITIADRDGVWFRLDSARLVWRRLALLSGRLDVDRLEIGRLEMLRRPLPADEPVAGADEPLLPELPVEVVVRDFKLAELSLGEPIVGTAARLTASGDLRLGDPSEGLNVKLDARRLDAPGTFDARLELVPQTQALTLALNFDEPEGGILARAASIPGLPPVKLDLRGNGTLQAFAANLNFDAGPDIGAQGGAQLQRDGTVRTLGLNLDARIEGLFPAVVAPVFAGTTRLGGNVIFGDDGTTRLADVAIASQVARLAVNGTIAKDYGLDIKVQAAALPNDGSRTRAGVAEIDKLAFDASIVGPAASPTVNATLEARDAKLPSGRFDSAKATFTAVSTGALSDRNAKITLSGDAAVAGMKLADRGYAEAVGDRLEASLHGTLDRSGVADFTVLRLQSPTLSADYTGRAGSRELAGRASVKVPDLARFRALTGLALRGTANLGAELSGAPRFSQVRAVVDGRTAAFGTGIAPVDNLAGGKLALAGTIRTMPRGGYGFDNLALTGVHAAATVNGEVRPEGSAVDAKVTVADLSRADSRLTGKGEATARLSGPLHGLAATARVALSQATALGRPIPQLALDVTAKDLLGPLALQATLAGRVGAAPASGQIHLAKRQEGGWLLDRLDLAVGSVKIDGGVTLDGANLASGRISIAAGNLDDISALLLTHLSGDLNAALALSADGGGQGVRLEANGNRLRFGDIRADRVAAQVAASDVYRRPVIDGSASIDRVEVAGQQLSQIRFDAKGTPAASDITLQAQAVGFTLSTRGRVVPGDATRIEIASFTARRGNRQLALAGPATVTLKGGSADIRNVAVAVDGGRISAEGLVGSELDLSVNARAVPLSAADIAVPGLGLTGTVDGEARLKGPAAQLAGDWRVRVARLMAPQLKGTGLPPIDATASGRLGAGRSSLDARANAGRVLSLTANGGVPLDTTGAIDLRAQGRLDLAVANVILAPAGRRLTGNANVDVRLGGTLARPAADGAVTIASGAYSDASMGMRVDRIQGRITARGQEVVVERLTAATPNGGTLALGGTVRLDPAAGFPGSLKITGRNAQLMNDGTVRGEVNLDLAVTGPLAQRPTIGGIVGIQTLDISVPEQLPNTLKPIPGTRQINPSPQARARLAVAAKAKTRGKRATPFDAVLNISVTSPGRIYVHGRGISADLGGQLMVTGLLSAPTPQGAFELQRGRFDLGSQTLNFTRGRVVFSGTLSPELDFIAENQSAGVTARIAVSGPAAEPVFTFSSSPDLPQEEVISRILFGLPAGQLSAFQAIQLAQIAGQFSGAGDSAFDQLRQSLGLSGSDVSGSGDRGPLGNLSRALGNRVRVNVRPGTSPETTGLAVDVDVTRHIRVQGLVGATGNTSVGVGAEWEY
ncbi:translocation/assembly module TamB domain-containing protein [Chelatococcus reniformis]|uniref:Translocation/assembly module TamB n=1 Tax=Chelatococcus reniformis TaxID=1494448 RepID=A0A916U381_9HYPH|nr:translocation/assembly module TamB domain-containing protein [Chelatococcus reniformis]GGC57664.1 translocation/assembly module TamB [Chelatococcus reniformis]